MSIVDSGGETGNAFAEIIGVLGDYFDGLYLGDTGILSRVFHPRAIYATAAGGRLLTLGMDDYLPVVAGRPAPAGRGEPRQDRILSIEFAGPVTALAKVECAIQPRRFIDFLTLVRVDGRWQIIAKVFHFDTEPEAAASL